MTTNNLIKIGYWYSDREPNFPMPEVGSLCYQCTEFGADPDCHCSNHTVIEYLENGNKLDAWRGFSSCRICGHVPNGSKCLTDGTYQWPEGLAHYVREHNTPLPQDFLDHISSQ